jgi:hypothetical protein
VRCRPQRRLLALVSGAASAVLACRANSVQPTPESCLQVEAPAGPVGFDAPFTITLRPRCALVKGGLVSWRQIAGAPLRSLNVSSQHAGFMVSARTPALSELLKAAPPWGPIPLSPWTRGEATLEATWTDGHGHTLRREVRVAAAARSRGLPNTPVGEHLHLGGTGWRLLSRPRASGAALEPVGELVRLLPDVAGDYQLADGAGRELVVRAARYDETLLDCGRSGCHPAVTDAAARSPMTSVLARGLTRAPGTTAPAFGPGYPDCALACHATGDPGVADGGFSHVAGELGATRLDQHRWEELPRSLRRLGGVGCLACHGPAALPPPAARWTLLRSDVCATCHDAPPRYGHVAAWRMTAMARAGRDARAATDRACARCHTTWGFLDATAGRRRPERQPPPEAGVSGLECAACHAVHDHDSRRATVQLAGPSPTGALLRTPPLPPLLAGVSVSARSRICLPCHTPALDDDVPTASAAALVLGRGGLDPVTGGPIVGKPNPTASGGCLGCHRSPARLTEAPGVEHGGSHGFRAMMPLEPPPSDLADRARRLWEAAGASGATVRPDGRPVHARGTRIDRNGARGRALWNVSLVLEDRAAGSHNPEYARALLDAAARALEGGKR